MTLQPIPPEFPHIHEDNSFSFFISVSDPNIAGPDKGFPPGIVHIVSSILDSIESILRELETSVSDPDPDKDPGGQNGPKK
jgi:hypothetical protein